MPLDTTELVHYETDAPTTNKKDGKLLADISRKIKQQEGARRDKEGMWAVCVAFLNDNQWVRYSMSRHQIFRAPNPKKRKRLTQNYIRNFVRKAVSRMMSQIPAWAPHPHSTSQKDRSAARLAVDVLRAKWIELQVERKLYSLLHWAVTTGTCLAQVHWDKLAGKEIEATAVNPETGQEEPQLDDDGEPVTFHLGDVEVEVVNPFEFHIDPHAVRLKDAAWCARQRIRTLSWIRQHFPKAGEKVQPDADEELKTNAKNVLGRAGLTVSGVTNKASSDEPDDQVALVTEYYEQPSPKNEKGLHAVCTRKVILHRGELVRRKYPFLMVRDQDSLLEFWGYSRTQFALDTQIEINLTVSQLAEKKNLDVLPKLLVPQWSGITKGALSSMPGEKILYKPVGGAKPEPLNLAPFPTSAYEYLKLLKLAMQEIFGFHDISMGATPKKVESGVAIQLLAEQDAEQQGSTTNDFQNFVKELGREVLAWVQFGYDEERTLSYTNEENQTIHHTFEGADLEGATDVELNLSTQLSESKAARIQQINDGVKNGIFDPRDPKDKRLIRRMMDFGQIEDFYEMEDLQRDLTEYEIEQMDQEKEVQPAFAWEDQDAAIEFHRRYMMRIKFVQRPPEGDPVRQLHEQHFVTHMERKEQMMGGGVGLRPVAGQEPRPVGPPTNFNPKVPDRSIEAPKGAPPPEPASR